MVHTGAGNAWRPRHVRAALALTVASAPACYAVLGLIGVAPVPEILLLAVYLAVATLALLALRVGLQLALLHEAHGTVHAGEVVRCRQCDHSVADMTFCLNCGTAMRALQRTADHPDRTLLVTWGPASCS